MPEGRIINNSGTLVQQFIIADPQGNARVSFQDDGTGHPIVVQENSYYGFGLIMPNSPVATPTMPNKQLYNGGSEWQNDYSNLPDYYQTFNRNYDAALGRFIGVDPVAESAESMTGYQYAGNNPIMNNDPDGDLLSLPGSHLPPYTPWQPLDFGHSGSLGSESLAEWEGQQMGADASGGGGGLYYLNPTAYWGLYNATGGTFGGINIFNDGSSSINAATALSVAPAVLTAVNNSSSGLDIFLNADNQLSAVPTGTSRSYFNTQNQDLSWNFGGAIDANQGSGSPGNLYHLPGNLPPYDPNVQIGNTCPFYVTAEALDYYTGRHLTGINVLDMYTKLKKLNNRDYDALYDKGMVARYLYPVFLNAEPTNDVICSLLNGYPVGAVISQQGISHDVLITGFSYFYSGPNAGFNYTFFNSQTNSYQNLPPSSFHDPYELTGVK